jgi:hypothetical protein
MEYKRQKDYRRKTVSRYAPVLMGQLAYQDLLAMQFRVEEWFMLQELLESALANGLPGEDTVNLTALRDAITFELVEVGWLGGDLLPITKKPQKGA